MDKSMTRFQSFDGSHSVIQWNLRRLLFAVKNAVFPLKCLACGRFFHRFYGDTDLLRLCVCDHCLAKVVRVVSPLCSRCGIPFHEAGSEDHLCGECIKRPGYVDFSRAVARYERTMKPLIQAYKYHGKIQAARPLGRLLFDRYCQIYLDDDKKDPGPDVIVPVPLHKNRFRKRGFNQAWLLIRHWPTWFRQTDGHRPCVMKDGMIRHRWTEPQAGLDRKTRQSNLKGAFSQSPSLDVHGKCVLLIDDVYTTGATAEECAKVLKKNGARAVHILTLARA